MIMGYIETLCTKCRKPIWVPEDKMCEDKVHECGGKLIPMELPHEDYITLTYIWNNRNLYVNGDLYDIRVNWDLYNAMVELKKNDIIEYNLKMSQFRSQVEQQKASTSQKANTVRCPRCGSTNITAGQRGYSLLTGFVGSGSTVNRCANCGHKWKP